MSNIINKIRTLDFKRLVTCDTITTDLKVEDKDLSTFLSEFYNEGTNEVYHDNTWWNLVSKSKDVLPLSNPPTTHTLMLKRIIKIK